MRYHIDWSFVFCIVFGNNCFILFYFQPYWQPHNRAVARRIQNMGWRADGGLWLLVRGGGLYLSKGTGVSNSENVIVNNLLNIFVCLKLVLNFDTLPHWDISIYMLYIHRFYSLFQTSFLHSLSLCCCHITLSACLEMD